MDNTRSYNLGRRGMKAYAIRRGTKKEDYWYIFFTTENVVDSFREVGCPDDFEMVEFVFKDEIETEVALELMREKHVLIEEKMDEGTN
jgi:hypothetical protein